MKLFYQLKLDAILLTAIALILRAGRRKRTQHRLH